jgi:predicted ester cyclase
MTRRNLQITRREAMRAKIGAVATAVLILPGMSRQVAAEEASDCSPGVAEAAAFRLLDRWVTAANAGDLSAYPTIYAENYIQHSGRSPSGLAAQITNARNLRAIFPDLRVTVADRIFGDGKIVARNLFTGTHRGRFRGFEPTGKVVTLKTIDIWRVADGKFAEHWDIVDFADAEKQLRGD